MRPKDVEVLRVKTEVARDAVAAMVAFEEEVSIAPIGVEELGPTERFNILWKRLFKDIDPDSVHDITVHATTEQRLVVVQDEDNVSKYGLHFELYNDGLFGQRSIKAVWNHLSISSQGVTSYSHHQEYGELCAEAGVGQITPDLKKLANIETSVDAYDTAKALSKDQEE